MVEPSPTVAFVCVQNAGRSQMAYAFARRNLDERELDATVLTGGTRPADGVHGNVVESMAELGIDLSDRTPREVTVEELSDADYVVTMGCSAEDVCPAGWGGENRDWGLDDPHGEGPEKTAEIRDEIRRRVGAFFDELEAEADGEANAAEGR
ncbi:low molecular weight phosphatase family protein [Halopelagius fulvigenes]|uniref:Low molecular weight phosphatase family protein n=1 Tax=Halopelagius fulvigenes TaxID=1198324 RepID=A0ABD5TZ49_9EURY